MDYSEDSSESYKSDSYSYATENKTDQSWTQNGSLNHQKTNDSLLFGLEVDDLFGGASAVVDLEFEWFLLLINVWSNCWNLWVLRSFLIYGTQNVCMNVTLKIIDESSTMTIIYKLEIEILSQLIHLKSKKATNVISFR